MRKQVGQIDADLLARVDALASQRGQTRRVVVERALEAVLAEEAAPCERALESVPGATAEEIRVAGQSAANAAGSLPPAPAPIRAHGKLKAGEPITAGEEVRMDATGAVVPAVPSDAEALLRATRPGLRSNGHLPSCKCWRCEKLSGAGGPVPKLDGAA